MIKKYIRSERKISCNDGELYKHLYQYPFILQGNLEFTEGDGMHFYLKKRIGTNWKIIEIETAAQLLENIDVDYHSFFVSSETFDESKFENFYDDEFCENA